MIRHAHAVLIGVCYRIYEPMGRAHGDFEYPIFGRNR